MKLSDDWVKQAVIAQGWIYYVRLENDKCELYKTKTGGTGRVKLYNDDIVNISVKDGWIYYSNATDNDKIYKITTDGTDKAKISDDKTNLVYAEGDWIYYLRVGSKLCKIKPDGSSKAILPVYGNIKSIEVAGEWVYFFRTEHDNKLYRVKTDGTIKEPLVVN